MATNKHILFAKSTNERTRFFFIDYQCLHISPSPRAAPRLLLLHWESQAARPMRVFWGQKTGCGCLCLGAGHQACFYLHLELKRISSSSYTYMQQHGNVNMPDHASNSTLLSMFLPDGRLSLPLSVVDCLAAWNVQNVLWRWSCCLGPEVLLQKSSGWHQRHNRPCEDAWLIHLSSKLFPAVKPPAV